MTFGVFSRIAETLERVLTDVVDAALELRGQRRRWGADKIRARLLTLHPDWSAPSARILHKYFLREGLVKKAAQES